MAPELGELRLAKRLGHWQVEMWSHQSHGDPRGWVHVHAVPGGLIDELVKALNTVLLFHRVGRWDSGMEARWRKATGADEATTKVLCDTVRAVLNKAREVGA